MSRVTLVGERRCVETVLPSQKPAGRLLPEVLRLLDDRVGTRQNILLAALAGVLGLFPLLTGVFGVHGQLLGTFA